jgi:hypothetical protein
MIRKTILYLTLLIVGLKISSAQEVVIGLQTNYNILKSRENEKYIKGGTATGPLELPFFDDFSGRSVFPDKKRWSDNFVFINNTYSDRQITTGIATFDAINEAGRLYETATSTGFEADHLTSQSINLNYLASDNIWLSFLYQPGGLGDLPEENDSLALQLYAPEESKWYSVWRVKGNPIQEFKLAMININQTRFLKTGFRFRFINYASLSANQSDPSMIGNCDQWNIDYVLLNKNRNANDTIFADVAFRLPLRSLLKSHEAIPWKQFRRISLQEMGSSIPVQYRNNDIVIRNVTRNFEIWDVYKNTISHSFSAGATNINPFTNVDYKANLIYTFNTDSNDSALFRITCSLVTDEFDPKGNDTLVYFQKFGNYFAFDDGSSEGGYGINGQGSRNAMVAYRFKSFIIDTLRAISICFNDSYLNSNLRAFDLMVWNDINGIPGDLLYTSQEVMVEQGEGINGFYTYKIPDGVMVNDVFYVGWKQRSETFLNAGFDVNTPHEGRQFYWISGDWIPSQVNGSIMIRPVVGEPLKTTSISNTYTDIRNNIRIWPNPASDFINIDLGEFQVKGSAIVTIIDITGRKTLEVPYNEHIDISSLGEGVFFLSIRINNRTVGVNRFIKTR